MSNSPHNHTTHAPSQASTPRDDAQLLSDIEPPAVVLATAGYDHSIRFWDVVSGVCTTSLQYNLSQVNCLALSTDKRMVAAAGHPQTHLFDTTSAAGPLRVLEGNGGNVMAVGFEADGRWLWTADEYGIIKVWDVRAARPQRNLDNKAAINGAVLHPNQGDILSVDQAGSLRIWDLTASACSAELIPEEAVPLRSVSVSADGEQVAVANGPGRTFVWKTGLGPADFVPVAKVQAHQAPITKCSFSPSAELLATTSADHSVKIWQLGGARDRGAISDDDQERSDADEDDTNDKDSLFSSDEDSTGTPLLLRSHLQGHLKWVWDCAWSADSAYLVSASSDTTARLWSVSNAECICIYTGHGKAVTSVALNDLAL